MKKLRAALLIVMLTVLTSCGPADWFFGIGEDGKQTEGTPPAEFFVDFIQALGPIGVLAAGAITTGGAVYAGNKRGQKPLAAVVAGVQKAKGQMSADDRAALVVLLKDNIPNRYHDTIKKIKDAI